MCRSIVSLRDPDLPASEDEITAAARQFVRKISGTKAKLPSRANQEAFDRAIGEIAQATARVLDEWVTPASSRRVNGASPSSSARRSPPTSRPPAATPSGNRPRSS